MTAWLWHFATSLWATCGDVLPIVAIIVGFQLLVIRKPLPNLAKTLIGFIYVIFGVTFFLEGLQMALFPLGKLMAVQLTAPAFLGIAVDSKTVNWQTYNWVYVFAACIGFATTLAEPSLLAVASKAEKLSGGAIGAWGLRIAVSLGVAFGIALGVFRIVSGFNIYYFIITGYVIVMIQTLFAPKIIIGLAYDSGGVTTSTVTVPLVTALGLGLASNVPGRNPLVDGFGLIAFASLFSIIAVLFYAQLAEWWSKRDIF
ncbi:MAG: DUF1538 domain-containing protein [Methylococcaceae bacterium]|nr:DUF1538 domain-containing protein [Methylococcaceae bacterium]